MDFPATISLYITQEEAAYRTTEIEVEENDNWNMSTHIHLSSMMKRGKFLGSTNDLEHKHAKRNIILPILRQRYRLQDIEVKDIALYVDEPDKTHYSFLVKKYWDDVFLIEHDFDTFLDRTQQDPIDFGGGLIKEDFLPEVIPLQRIAFCDQTNVLGYPIGLKYVFFPDELRAKAREGWGEDKNGATISLKNLIARVKYDPKSEDKKSTGRKIEVYVVHGQMPREYLADKEYTGDNEELVNQVQIIAFYEYENQREFQILYRKKETKQVYKFYNPEEIFGRGLGMGGVEELFDAQMWTDFAQKAKHEMLESASKVLPWTDDPAFASRNKIKDMENVEWSVIGKGSKMGVIQNASPNIQLFTQAFLEWEQYANRVGGNTEALSGESPAAGTPFRLQERVVLEGKGLPEWRKGRYAKFIEEVIRDWILPRIEKEIVKGKKFLATLTADEMQFLTERVATNRAATAQMESVLNGEIPEDFETLKREEREKFSQQGNQHLLEILQDELKDVRLKVKINIAGKQKDLFAMVDKITSVLRQYFASPQMMQDPFALKLLQRMMEAAGMPMEDVPLAPRPVQMPENAMLPVPNKQPITA